MNTEKICLQSISAPDSNRQPKIIGPYLLGRRIGKGGMAEVFAATQRGAAGFERTVCIKRLLPHLGHDPDTREALAREAKLLGSLEHGNIVSVHDCIYDGNSPAIVMELVDGMDLKTLIRALYVRGTTLTDDVVAHVVGEVLRGLVYAHRRRIIHRDLSPHNVLTSLQGVVKITDFGIAKVLATLATRTDALKGKLYYLSPEQARGQRVDHRTDLYAVGLLAYEMLTGRRFHKPVKNRHIVEVIAEAKPPRLEDIDSALTVFLEQLLAPRPKARFETAREALLALPQLNTQGSLCADKLGEIVREMIGRREGDAPLPPDGDESTEISPLPTSPIVAHRAVDTTTTLRQPITPHRRRSPSVRPTIELPTCRSKPKAPIRRRPSGGAPLIGKVVAAIACIFALLALGLALGVGGSLVLQ